MVFLSLTCGLFEQKSLELYQLFEIFNFQQFIKGSQLVNKQRQSLTNSYIDNTRADCNSWQQLSAQYTFIGPCHCLYCALDNKQVNIRCVFQTNARKFTTFLDYKVLLVRLSDNVEIFCLCLKRK